MVTYNLMITAEVENVSTIQPMGGCDDPNFTYYFKLRCENCGEVTPKETCVVLQDVVPLPKSRGQANLVQKCKFCGREGNITMIPKFGRPLTGADCEAGEYAPLMSFDCRGLEPLEYSFGCDQWKVETTAGTVFENVNLSGGDWVDYDENGSMPVSVDNLKSRFDVVKSR
ncbi:uncharacterized protein LOC104886392 [Beta vulgaris subsp. vulgaris]|uniref:uncharacterized protein LOC104886392 n=1 Tax=Beta vulgaris subsp. vulgaris TaxID=3555 RepID=UPI002036D355|nr:uncharacterized protein LOC104886392 [Beta vulgaris subsp. vulgaris]